MSNNFFLQKLKAYTATESAKSAVKLKYCKMTSANASTSNEMSKMENTFSYELITDINFPKDGNYLITKVPIEECVLCYSPLSLHNSIFNVKYLFYKFWCKCGIEVFYLPKYTKACIVSKY